MMVPRLSGFTTQTTQLMPGCSSSWPNFSGFVPDRDVAGRLDPVLAAQNRQVIIEHGS